MKTGSANHTDANPMPTAPVEEWGLLVASGINGALQERYWPPVKFAEDTDIWASAFTASDTSRVEVSFDLVLIPNT